MARRSIAVLTVALLCGLTSASSASTPPRYDRMYMLGADTNYLYWSVDRFDPELGMASTTRYCGTYYLMPNAKPCLMGINTDGTRTHNLFFLPGAALDEDVTWSSETPLRYHFEATVNTFGVPYTVQLVVQKSSTLAVSAPATQTSPGVWEGQMTTGGPMLAEQVNNIGLRVTTQSPVAVVDMLLGGRSYVQLPSAFAAHGVPDMVREDTYSPQPGSYATPTRSFSFNDDRWAARTLTGDTTGPKTFDFTIDQHAEMLLVWADLYESTVVQDVRRLRTPDLKKLQGIGLSLSQDGAVIDHTGGNGAGAVGQGTPSLAVMDLPAGPLSLTVDPWQDGADLNLPYTVHVLEIRGERTLRMMRWLFMNGTSSRTPAAATCPATREGVPATSKVKSIGLDLDWNTEAVGLASWSIRFAMPYGEYPCSEGGTGDELRLTIPPSDRVWWVGATPAYGSTFVSAHDTTFQMTARYVYSPPPVAS